LAATQFQVLQDHLDSGFRILKYERKFGNYLFSIWEFGQPFIISVEDNEEVAKFIESGAYRKYLLEEVMRCVVLIDIVGFSKLENQQQLQKIIRLQCFLNDPRIRDYEIAEKVPMGDGAIISFSQANRQKAMDFVKELTGLINDYNQRCEKSEKHLTVRMGINYGMVHRFTDINKVGNIIGDGVNRCERIASKGEAGHVLASESVYNIHFKENNDPYRDAFYDCGIYKDKHALEFRIYNVNGQIGSVQLGISKPPAKT
jgi:hypothetical protein